MKSIVTASWSTRLDTECYCRIGISRGAPRGQSGFKRYTKLNPGPWFNSVSPEQYRELYYGEILDRLDPHSVVAEVMALADGRAPVLCCFEPSTGPAWCHRGFISAWLHDTLGLKIFEVSRETDGCGWSHPKIPAPLRKRSDDLFDR